MTEQEIKGIKTLGDLKKSGYQSKSIKDELRQNLLIHLNKGESVFEGIHGYEDTVIPDMERAILSRHNINLLGLRGQAKTRLARKMTMLLDEYLPFIGGSDLNEDPFEPLTAKSKDLLLKLGDETPIEFIHRSERYVEKLATPDVSVADLIGDIDPIKAVNEKLAYNDERVIHYGLIPRANRSIFVLNEIPDLQARIQVSLFNILQEKDIQIRGFTFRIPLDIQFVFTANPEDYTNRGSIVTPLKDRIGSQILTHYPKSTEIARKITQQEAQLSVEQKEMVQIPDLLEELIEQVVFEARSNEFIDPKSGVSARLSISAMENLASAVERRAVINHEKRSMARIGDLLGIVPAITGKIEMVYEGELEGSYNVAVSVIGKAIRHLFNIHFPSPSVQNKEGLNPYHRITEWFEKGNTLLLKSDSNDREYARTLNKVEGLAELVDNVVTDNGKMDKYLWMEFALHGLSEHSKLSKLIHEGSSEFGDLLGSMLSGIEDDNQF